MSKWKLCRQMYGNEVYTFLEGDEVTIGRGLNNTIPLKSLVVSRNHCIINAKGDEVTITDLKSSNGIYVGLNKIPPNTPYAVSDGGVIGFGWTKGIADTINDSEKFVFSLKKETSSSSLLSKLQFQNEHELDLLDAGIASYNNKTSPKGNSINTNTSPILITNPSLKRKLSLNCNIHTKIRKECIPKNNNKKISKDDVIVLSDSDIDIEKKEKNVIKENNICSITENVTDKNTKCENEDFEYEAFSIKQEYLGYNEDDVLVISDSDSESEHWYMRLSQSSPGKPFTKVEKDLKEQVSNVDSSYSQIDDDLIDCLLYNNNDEKNEDLSIPPQPLQTIEGNILDPMSNQDVVKDMDTVDGSISDACLKQIIKNTETCAITNNEVVKKIQLIEPLMKPSRRKSHIIPDNKVKTNNTVNQKSNKHSKSKKVKSLKKSVSKSQKEERKQKLKDLAGKDKKEPDQTLSKDIFNNSNKSIANVKVTISNRSAFLSDIVQATIKPMKRKESRLDTKIKQVSIQEDPKCSSVKSSENKSNNDEVELDITIKNQNKEHKLQNKAYKSKSQSSSKTSRSNDTDKRIPLKSVKPLTESEETFSGKPVSIVEPLPPEKPKKSVRFSEVPEIRVFEIEPGNKMNKTSSVKTKLLDSMRQIPIFSLEKITLMKILRWNPQWLNEQKTNVEPPPILGHNNPPMGIFHSFQSHAQYVQLVGDLLLMEIWECLTQAYLKISNQINNILPLRIDSLPPVPPQERYFELFNLSVKISIPVSELKSLPRTGEILLIEFGPENAKTSRFFFVHNVRTLPSPPNNKFSFHCISLYATFNERMKSLRPGELILGRSLAYINNELTLFEAMEQLAKSPLSEAILRPDPRHFPKQELSRNINLQSQWTETLNPSQKMAISNSVTAALRVEPSIQMVQGPPGTGKSSVICTTVMTYFYDAAGRKHQIRGKILICATSNAAVDELVIRLLNIRQRLPKAERFRMVRVGRLEAMHPRARDVSSQQLAQREARAHVDAAPHPALDEEISHLEAKINMWKTTANEAKDPVRVAYCQGRVSNIADRIAMLRGGNGGSEQLRPERLLQSERRIIECADIIVTTLASAHNHKLRGLKGRIALCIVDEAGQAIEPEALIPLTLGVTRLTLIGDPQQLPGYICSQRAKKHGLGESLFSRLSSCTEHWAGGSPVVLLNQQYRMHPHIADYPNRAFYGGRVLNSPPGSVDLNIPPYCIVSICSGDKGQGSSGANEVEAWGVARIVSALTKQTRARRLSLALITPYAAHRDLLRRCLRQLADTSDEGEGVEVNTVDSFQGQERDVVVVSLARSHGVGFLTDAGRMNVMLTRARSALLVCLNPLATAKNNQWRTLVEDAQRRNLYTTLPNKICQGAAGEAVTNEEVLRCITQLKPRP